MYYITVKSGGDGTELYYLSKDNLWVFDKRKAHKYFTRLIARIVVSRLVLALETVEIVKIYPYGEMDNHISVRS